MVSLLFYVQFLHALRTYTGEVLPNDPCLEALAEFSILVLAQLCCRVDPECQQSTVITGELNDWFENSYDSVFHVSAMATYEWGIVSESVHDQIALPVYGISKETWQQVREDLLLVAPCSAEVVVYFSLSSMYFSLTCLLSWTYAATISV